MQRVEMALHADEEGMSSQGIVKNFDASPNLQTFVGVNGANANIHAVTEYAPLHLIHSFRFCCRVCAPHMEVNVQYRANPLSTTAPMSCPSLNFDAIITLASCSFRSLIMQAPSNVPAFNRAHCSTLACMSCAHTAAHIVPQGCYLTLYRRSMLLFERRKEEAMLNKYTHLKYMPLKPLRMPYCTAECFCKRTQKIEHRMRLDALYINGLRLVDYLYCEEFLLVDEYSGGWCWIEADAAQDRNREMISTFDFKAAEGKMQSSPTKRILAVCLARGRLPDTKRVGWKAAACTRIFFCTASYILKSFLSDLKRLSEQHFQYPTRYVAATAWNAPAN
eukprot:IDg14649t1